LSGAGFSYGITPPGLCVSLLTDGFNFGKKGSADILGCLLGGKFLAVEYKAPAGRLAPEQSAFLEKVRG